MKNITLFTTLFCFLGFSFLSNAQAISGDFTVGTSASDYETLALAIQDLQDNGVGTGGATLTISPGIYSGTFVLENIAGLSADNQLIITAAPNTVTFESQGTTATEAFFRVNSLSWITFNELDLVDVSAISDDDIEYGYQFEGSTAAGCLNNTISNGSIFLGANGARPETNTRGILFRSRGTDLATSNSNNIIDNMSIDNSSWGIQFRAAANFFGAITQEDNNNQIVNCVFGANASLGHEFSSGALAINGLGERDFIITGNIIESIQNFNADPAIPASTSGISLDSCSGEISNNMINSIEYESTLGSIFGIRSSTLAGAETLIKNNTIRGLQRSNIVASTTDPSLTVYGIWIFEQSGNNGLAKIYNNTIVLTGDTPFDYSSTGVQLRGGSTGEFPAEVFNNIIVNNLSTTSDVYKSFALSDGNTNRGFLISDHNLLFAGGTNGFLGGIGRELGGTEQFTNDLAEFIIFSETNANSVNFLPELEDLENGDFSIPGSITSPELYLAPTLSEVPLDILGLTRFTPNTFVGAYEGPETLSVLGSNRNEITLYPNPSETILNISSALPLNANASAQIIDISGKKVMTVDDLSGINSKIEIDVTLLESGLYILNLQNGEQTLSQKFLIK